MWDEVDLELGEDLVPLMKVLNILRRTVNNPITYENEFPLRKRVLIS